MSPLSACATDPHALHLLYVPALPGIFYFHSLGSAGDKSRWVPWHQLIPRGHTADPVRLEAVPGFPLSGLLLGHEDDTSQAGWGCKGIASRSHGAHDQGETQPPPGDGSLQACPRLWPAGPSVEPQGPFLRGVPQAFAAQTQEVS